jgi:hypothetical protein
MIEERRKVREELFRTVLEGGDPYYDFESAWDNGVNWLRLSPNEFQLVVRKAKAERAK